MLGLDLALIGKAKILFREFDFLTKDYATLYEQRFTTHQYLEHEYKLWLGVGW